MSFMTEIFVKQVISILLKILSIEFLKNKTN